MKQKNTKLIMCISCLVLLAGGVTGVSVLAKSYNKAAVTKMSLKKGDTKKLQWKNISKANRKSGRKRRKFGYRNSKGSGNRLILK